MELTEAALSEAVEAHFTQSDGDLREEISLMRTSSSSRNVTMEKSTKFLDEASYYSASHGREDRELAHSPFSHPHFRLDHHRRDEHFQPPYFSSRSRFDERFVHQAPHHVIDAPYQRAPIPKRFVQAFHDHDDYKKTFLPNAKSAWRSRAHSPSHYHYLEEEAIRHHSLQETGRHSRQNHPSPMPPYSGSHKMEAVSEGRNRPFRPDQKLISAPSVIKRETRLERESPLPLHKSPTRRRPKSKRHSTRIPSRVASEDASEESFDDMLKQYKKIQVDHHQHNEPLHHDFDSSMLVTDHLQSVRDARYSKAEIPPIAHGHGSHVSEYASPPMLEERELRNAPEIQPQYLHPVHQNLNAPPTAFDPQSSLVTNSGPIPDNRSVANEAVYETALGTDDVQLPSKESVAETTEDENTREEIDEEDDDEELLKLRLAALSSAYNRNIDIAKESSASEEKDNKSDLQNVDESKSRKKKTKQPKEKKKSAKKDAKKSIRTSANDKEAKKTSQSPDGDDKILSLARKIRSPEKDFSDPKILTLGSEVMKKKSIQEQGQLREIRSLKDPEEGCKRFMDLIQSKNNRDLKKQKGGDTKKNNVDNYEEVEMDVDSTSAEEHKLEVFQLPLPQSEPVHPPEVIDRENDAGSDASAHSLNQPLPPGVDDRENEMESNLHPHQESIWEMLEQPLVAAATQVTVTPLPYPSISTAAHDVTSADMLISSIRAKLSENSSISEASATPSSQTQLPISAPAEPPKITAVDRKEEVTSASADVMYDACADSPCDFEHAFQLTSNPESYPAIATDLSFARPDDRVELDADVIDPDHAQINSQDAAMKSITVGAIIEKESDSSTLLRQKLPSTEDEHEMRALLLSDLAKRRAKDAKTSEQTAAEENMEETTIVRAQTSPPVATLQPLTKDAETNSSVGPEPEKKKNNAKTRRYHVWKQIKKKRRAQRRKELRERQATLTGANSAPLCDQTNAVKQIPVQTSITSTIFDGSKSVEMKQKKRGQSRPNLKVIVPTAPAASFPARSVVPAAPSASSLLDTKPARAKAPSQPAKVCSSVLNQRPRHPPVVVNFDPSSDEEDHVIGDLKANAFAMTQAQQNRTSTFQTSIAKSASCPSLLPHPLVLAAASKQPTYKTALKRKIKNEAERPAKKHQPTFSHQDMPKTANAMQSLNQYALKKVKESEDTRRKLSDVEEKLKKVRNLLGQDKQTLSRLQQKQKIKEVEAQEAKTKIDGLKLELRKYESVLVEANDAVEKIKSDFGRASNTMEQRKKLESKFLREIEILQREINNEAINSDRLIAAARGSQAVDAIRSVRRKAGDKVEKNDKKLGGKYDAAKKNVASNRGFLLDKKTIESATDETNTPLVQSNDKINQLQNQRKILKEKERRLKLQKEKLLLKKTEINLQLIKKKAKQSLRAKKLGRTMMEQSIYQAHQIQRRASVGLNRNKPVRPAIKNRLGTNSTANLDETNSKRRTRRVSITLPSNKNIDENKRRKDLKLSESDLADHGHGEDYSITPVTPTLKRTRSTERRSSSSSITTPPSAGYNDMHKLDEHTAMEMMIPRLSVEETNNLRCKISEMLSPAVHTRMVAEPSNYLALTEMFPIPECFSNWCFDASELTKQSGRPTTSAGQQQTCLDDVENYSSSLLRFRSYRLSSFFRLHKTRKLASQTYSNKLDCNKLLCRYDLTGKCLDAMCIGQHLKDITSSPAEIYLDLLWYCPKLLRTDDGKQITISDPIELQLKVAEETVDRLCGEIGIKTPHSVEHTCKLLVGIMSKKFGNKRSITTLMGKQRPRISSSSKDNQDVVEEQEESFAEISDPASSLNFDPRFASDPELRYFIEDEKKNEIEKLISVLKNSPSNETARIKLAQAYLDQSQTEDKRQREGCVELALNALCLGIELNDQSEALWSFYIPTLRQHYIDTSVAISEIDILDQAVMLMPLSRKVWNEILKWDWPLDKLDDYYEQLIENLLTRQQLAKSEEHPNLLSSEPSYYSAWLLQSIVERCHLLLHARGIEPAQNMLEQTVQKLRNASDEQEHSQQQYWPLCQGNVAKLWLIYIYMLEYHQLPPCIYDQDASSHVFGMVLGFGDVVVPFTSSHRLAPERIRELFREALYCSTDHEESRVSNAKRRFSIYKSMVNFEASLENWDELSRFCRGLVDLFSDEAYTSACSQSVVDVWVMWTEAVMRSNNIIQITQIYDEAVTACPQSARLAYMSALYQLTSHIDDDEAALTYLEKYVTSVLDLQDVEDLPAAKLHQLYRRILRHDVTIKQSSRLLFKTDASQQLIEKEKPYLWLIYCMLTELMQNQDEVADDDQVHVPDLYEAALHILPHLEDRKIVWIQYLLYLRSHAPCSTTASDDESKASQSMQRREQVAWFKRFTSVVRRCLATIPCKFSSRLNENCFDDTDAESYTDYTFHNEASAIYLACFSSSQTSVALGILADAMPSNIPLLIRATRHFLESDDYYSILSLLWRLTSAYSMSKQRSCKDIQLWQTAMRALVKDGKYKKAIQLCKRALRVLPRTKILWHDAITLMLAHGDARDLRRLNERCRTMLSTDIKSLVASTLDSLSLR